MPPGLIPVGVEGLDVGQLRARAVPSSELTIGGPLKHLAICENDIFARKFAGARPETLTLIPERADPHTWQFTVGATESADDVEEL